MAIFPVAKTILDQLGGQRFSIMTGAHGFTAAEDRLYFSIPRNPKRISDVSIRLDPSDTYTVTFWKLPAGRWSAAQIVVEREGIYAENLVTVFECETGLATSL